MGLLDMKDFQSACSLGVLTSQLHVHSPLSFPIWDVIWYSIIADCARLCLMNSALQCVSNVQIYQLPEMVDAHVQDIQNLCTCTCTCTSHEQWVDSRWLWTWVSPYSSWQLHSHPAVPHTAQRTPTVFIYMYTWIFQNLCNPLNALCNLGTLQYESILEIVHIPVALIRIYPVGFYNVCVCCVCSWLYVHVSTRYTHLGPQRFQKRKVA